MNLGRGVLLVRVFWLIGLCFFAFGELRAQKKAPSKAQSSTSYDVMIMGTILSKQAGQSVALVKEMSSSKVKALKVGYLLLGKYPVLTIAKDHIIIRDLQKRQITLYKDQFSEGSTQGLVVTAQKTPALGREYREAGLNRKTTEEAIEIQITSAYRDNMVKNDLQKILMEAAATPYMQGGKITGFELTDITPGSIYEKAGFENGDVITAINAVPLTSPTGAIKVLHSVKGEGSVEATLMRGGRQMNMTISVQ